jgi:threonine/homoserine/homoserine lactone efflux protein
MLPLIKNANPPNMRFSVMLGSDATSSRIRFARSSSYATRALSPVVDLLRLWRVTSPPSSPSAAPGVLTAPGHGQAPIPGHPSRAGRGDQPVLFLLTLTTLTGVRPLVRGIALTAGAAIPLVLLGAFAFAISGSLHASSTTKAGVDLALGVLLLLVGLRALAKGPAEPKPAEEPKRPAGPGRSFALGFGAMATNVTTLALYVPAMKLIATSHVSDADRAAAHVIVALISLRRRCYPSRWSRSPRARRAASWARSAGS